MLPQEAIKMSTVCDVAINHVTCVVTNCNEQGSFFSSDIDDCKLDTEN